MDIRLGNDIVHIPRIQAAVERFGERFLQRIYTQIERQDCSVVNKSTSPHSSGLLIPKLAGRWAAKEAVVKALGTGFRGITWREIEIVRHASGAPQVKLYGQAARQAASWGNYQWRLSISHERDYAIATAILLSY